jgi:hypothetical protein
MNTDFDGDKFTNEIEIFKRISLYDFYFKIKFNDLEEKNYSTKYIQRNLIMKIFKIRFHNSSLS